MKSMRHVVVIGAGLIFVLSASTASAQTTEADLAIIRSRCDAAKSILDQQRKHDLVSRINRGRAYQTLLDQQQAFSQRLRNNKLPSDAFDRQSAAVESGVEHFRTSYNHYDDAMGKLLGIDCHNQPAEFATQLQTVRSLRAVVGDDSTDIEANLQTYRQGTVSFQQELQRLSNAISGAQ